MCVVVVSVCLSVHREVCVYLLFALTHPHPSPATGSTTRRFYEAAAVVAEKDCSGCRVHTCVCLRNVKMSFSQHQRPAHHREVERGVFFFFQVRTEKGKKNCFLCVCVCDLSLLHFTETSTTKLPFFILLGKRERKDCNQMRK